MQRDVSNLLICILIKPVFLHFFFSRASKLTQLLKESMGNASCQMGMIAHVSSAVHAYNETLQVIQLASKIHRTRRRTFKKVCDPVFYALRHRRLITIFRVKGISLQC